MKKSHFLGEKGWDWDTPLPPHLDIVPCLSQVWPPFSCPFFRGSNKLLNWWDIAPPIYVLCVSSHLWTVPRQIKFWTILIKSWDWRDPPPPSLGQNPKLTQKKAWTAPLSNCHRWWYPIKRQYYLKCCVGRAKYVVNHSNSKGIRLRWRDGMARGGGASQLASNALISVELNFLMILRSKSFRILKQWTTIPLGLML